MQDWSEFKKVSLTAALLLPASNLFDDIRIWHQFDCTQRLNQRLSQRLSQRLVQKAQDLAFGRLWEIHLPALPLADPAMLILRAAAMRIAFASISSAVSETLVLLAINRFILR